MSLFSKPVSSLGSFLVPRFFSVRSSTSRLNPSVASLPRSLVRSEVIDLADLLAPGHNPILRIKATDRYALVMISGLADGQATGLAQTHMRTEQGLCNGDESTTT